MTDSNRANLYELLRQKRNKLAKDAKVEPYMILHNKVLQVIAEKKPSTLEELVHIKGMGQKRLAKYGKFILETVNSTSDNSNAIKTEEKIFSVSEYIDSLNQILIPQTAVIIGEVSSISPRGNYTFFSLHDKNADALLNCFIWQNRLEEFGVELKVGLELKIAGFPKIYERYGKLTFEVNHLGLIGEGALKLALEKLKKKLEAKGYFALERKKALPKYVAKIGLITSGFGDAKNDFLTHLGKFGFKIYFYDVRVEGLYAIDDITKAIRWFNENLLDVEVLVLTRGGGSLENLQAFNSEAVAKAMFGSKIPIITGIGHENDKSIVDLVADMYASTPTHAARILSDPWRNVNSILVDAQTNAVSVFLTSVKNYKQRIINNEKNIIDEADRFLKFKTRKLNDLQDFLGLQFAGLIHEIKQIQLKFLNNWEILISYFKSSKKEIATQEKILINECTRWLKIVSKNLVNLEQQLNLGSPEIRLKQGYSIIFNTNSKIIKSSKQIKVGDSLNLKFHQGGASSKVERIKG